MVYVPRGPCFLIDDGADPKGQGSAPVCVGRHLEVEPHPADLAEAERPDGDEEVMPHLAELRPAEGVVEGSRACPVGPLALEGANRAEEPDVLVKLDSAAIGIISAARVENDIVLEGHRAREGVARFPGAVADGSDDAGQGGLDLPGGKGEACEQAGMKAVIPPKKNRQVQREYDHDIYKERHLVENAFEKLKRWRGVATRYAKNTASFLAAVHIRCLIIWLGIS